MPLQGTADHLVVWFPEAGVLLPGDNWYHAFPNLYAIRGTPYRVRARLFATCVSSVNFARKSET